MKESPKILVVGCKGKLGAEIMQACAEHDVTGWDSSDLDVTDEHMVWDKVTALKPDLVFNCTGYNDVDKAEEDRVTSENINAYAPGYIAKACQSVGAIMVHFSTGMVFDGRNPEGYAEDDSPMPVNSYGRSKLAGELEATGSLEQLYVIRTSWLFGRQGESKSSKRGFVEAILEKAATGSVTLVDDELGNPTYAKDLAQASFALVEMAKPFGTYHITNTGTVSRLDWAKEIFRIKGLKPQIATTKGNALARMAKRPQFEVLNNTKFIQLRPWTEALKEYLQAA